MGEHQGNASPGSLAPAPIYTPHGMNGAAGMEPSHVLMAHEEWERWRSRKTRVERELHDLRQRREALRRELDRVRRDLAALEDALFKPPQSGSNAMDLAFRQGR